MTSRHARRTTALTAQLTDIALFLGAPASVVGAGTRIWHQAQVMVGATVGADCILGKGAFLGPGTRLGDRVKIGNGAHVFGATVGDDVMICPGALCLEDPAPPAP